MLSKFSVRKPFTVFVSVILIILLGVISFTRMSTDLLPKMTLPYAAVITTYPGASPEKVELSVTKPIEQTLATTSGVEKVTSISSANTSMVILQFTQDTNMDSAMIEMSSSLDLVKGQLAEQVGSPMIMKIDPNMLPVMVASVDMEGKDSREITQLVQDTVVPEFERLGGVASVTSIGLVEDSLKVTLNDEKIQALNEKVLASVDKGLAEAEKKLDEGEAALKEARSKLDSEQKKQLETLTEQNLQLSAGLNQLNLVLSVLPEDTSSLNELAASLESGKNDLSATLDKVQSGVESVTDAIDLDTLQTVSNGLQTAADGAGKLAEELKAAFPEEDSLYTTARELETALRNAKTNTDRAISLLQGLTDPSAFSQLEELENSLDKGMEEIKGAIEQLPQLRQTLTEQQQLTEAKKQLDMGIQTLTGKMTEASVALTTQETELKKGREELESSREEAYKKAGLDGVITRDTISGLLTAQNFSMPAGYLSEGETQYTVRVGDALASQEELENLVLFHMDGDVGDIALKDVADIEMTDNSGEMYAKINGNDGILLSFQKQSTASTTDVSDDIRRVMQQLTEENPGLHITPLQDQGIYINIIIQSVLENLLMGGILAVLILLLFLRSIRPTIVVALSIPISLTFALVLMYFSGVTLNIISLSGLALGVGMLVDNSIVVIENTYRLRAEGMSAAEAAMHGAGQVAGAIFSSTLTTVCVFLPIVFTEGMTRQLFTDMGLTIAYSLMASLLVALTLVPAMSAGLLRKVPQSKDGLFARFAGFYGKLLGGALRFKPVVLAAVLLLFVFSLWQATQMGTAFIPETDSMQMSVTMEMPKDATTEETREMANTVAERIQQVEGVDTVGAMEGSGMMAMAGGGGISIYVTLDENRSLTSQQIADEIEKSTEDLDCTVTATGSSMDLSALGGSGVQLVIKGPELDELERIAQDLGEMLEKIDGTVDIDNGLEETEPEIKVTVDKEKAMKYQLTVAQVYQEVTKAISSETTATTLTQGTTEYPVLLVEAGKGVTHKTLKDHPITVTKDGKETEITLGDVAEITMEQSLSSIQHDDQTRTLTVSAGVDSSHNIGLVGREVEKALESFSLPDGYTVELAGENENIQQTLNDMLLMILLAVVCIYLIMVAEFQSLLSPFIVMFTIPLAFTGGLLALLITGTELSMIAMLGFLVLSGVVVNNGIVFVDYVNQLRLGGMEKRDALILAGKTRLRPILMTALTTILGLSTMALGMGSGSDMVQPLAIVTIGGLLYATVLTLVVVPCLYDLMNRRPLKKHGEEEQNAN